jgi:hypothetical protein
LRLAEGDDAREGGGKFDSVVADASLRLAVDDFGGAGEFGGGELHDCRKGGLESGRRRKMKYTNLRERFLVGG